MAEKGNIGNMNALYNFLPYAKEKLCLETNITEMEMMYEHLKIPKKL